MESIGKGHVHIYTGNGKGKTTAALGLALRAAGHGLRTVIVQFMKGQHYSELVSVGMLNGLVSIEQFGHPEFCRIIDPPDPEDVARAQEALKRLHEIMEERSCDILIADEMITAGMFNLVSEDAIIGLIESKPSGMELVLTGRGVTEKVIAAADLVTEMKEIKHYYTEGVQARKGIES